MSLLEVKHLSIGFRGEHGTQSVVTDVSFRVEHGEVLAIVGESGCGKSVTCQALGRLLPSSVAEVTGEILVNTANEARDILKMGERELRSVRGGVISYIFQEPGVCLNPVFRVGDQIEEAVKLHQRDVTDTEKIVVELLREVGIPDPATRAKCYPHELSGGMQQRVMIALALACKPSILVADEPTTALDVTIQAQILDLLGELKRRKGLSILLVTHNLGIVSEVADRVAVMYAGRIVETGPVSDVIAHPRHPYTRALVRAVPVLGGERERLATIRGTVPSPDQFGKGCRFYGRCEFADHLTAEEQQRCEKEVPSFVPAITSEKSAVSTLRTHCCACHFTAEVQKSIESENHV